MVEYQGLDGLRGSQPASRPCGDNILLREPRFQMRTAVLDHGIPVLAFALEETVAINVWRNEVEALGLKIEPWLRVLKEKAARGDADDPLIEVQWLKPAATRPRALPLGELKRKVLQFAPGRKIAHVVDVAYSPENVARTMALASKEALRSTLPLMSVNAGDGGECLRDPYVWARAPSGPVE